MKSEYFENGGGLHSHSNEIKFVVRLISRSATRKQMAFLRISLR